MSLAAWDALTALDAAQAASVALLDAFVSSRAPTSSPLATVPPATKPVTQVAASSAAAVPATQAPTPAAPVVTAKAPTPTKATKVISNTAEFLSWFSQLEKDMEQEHEHAYWMHLANLRSCLQECDELLADVDAARTLIDSQQGYFAFVEKKTEQLKGECESLLAEQQALQQLASDVADRLHRFNVLEPALVLLNKPGTTRADSPVLDPDFVPTLARLDEALKFVDEHASYRDAPLYKMKFRQCITRALSLIKIFVVGELASVASAIAGASSGGAGASAQLRKPIAPTQEAASATAAPEFSAASAAMAYAKFKAAAESLLRPLIFEIEARVPAHPEYAGLLGECLSAYFGVRRSLIGAGVAKKIDAMLSESTDVMTVVKHGAAYITSLSTDENALFQLFFSTSGTVGDSALVEYLDSLCVGLHDHLRPRIVREQRIDVLSEICRELSIGVDVGGEYVDNTAESPLAPVRFVVGKILEDAQERLAFRATEYIPIPNAILAQANMVPNLVPDVQGTLNPELESSAAINAQSVLSPTDSNAPPPSRTDSIASLSSMSREDQIAHTISAGKIVYGSGEWYPTLNKTLYILGKLYRAVPRAIFEDLSQEAIDLCRMSMVSASEVIGSKNTQLDGQLFLIKNLLTLREQLASFDSPLPRPAEDVLDFTSMAQALKSLLSADWSSLAANAAQLPQLIVPRVRTLPRRDARAGVADALRVTCEAVIVDVVKACVDPVTGFMAKATAVRLRSGGPAAAALRIGSQAFAAPARCVECANAFAESVRARLGAVVAKFGDYLGDRKTEGVLLQHIKTNIIDAYASFCNIVMAEHDSAALKEFLSVERMAEIVDVCCAQNARVA
ncbi:hypothetical protein HDU84_008058 [Entophlyctis sp. JEL0112]|nr:hypothetical protein HDU84_008058 [Entophlyctis sp. JEL0112]